MSLKILGLIRILWYVPFLHFFFAFLRGCCWCFGVWHFCTSNIRFQRWYFHVWHFCTNSSRVQRWSTPCILLALKFLILSPIFKTSSIVIVWLCAHSASNLYSFYKNMIWRTPMDNILRPSNSGSGVPESS